MASNRKFEDLDLSKDEVKRLGEALKDENFRKMLVEYAEEISDPENRRKAEEEIAMMEQERGMNVQFIHPQPGYVMKTTVDGSKKAFINICQNDKIEKPKAKRQVGIDGKSGLMWQIPHSFAPPKDDIDKVKQSCKVFDVVFHPDTFRMATSNERFKKLVEDTAVEGIERQFSVTLDKKNIKYPKMKFKGVATATVIRERVPDAEVKPRDPNDFLNQMPYPYDSKTSAEKSKENEAKNAKKTPNGHAKTEDNKFTQPKYSITHRSDLDMSEYRNAPDAKTSTRPKELIIKIELPLLKSAAQASLDIFERKLVLESVLPAAYKLDLTLPFPVNEDEGSAKFDKSKKTLTVTLPVIPEKAPPLPFTETEESDAAEIESDNMNENRTPLIEVLSNNTNGDSTLDNDLNTESIPENGDVSKTIDNALHNAVINNESSNPQKMTFPQNVKWILPDHQFLQDNETVSFVIKVQNVEEKSVSMFFPQSSTAMVQFMSIGSGCFPVYYSLYVEFPDGCDVSSEHCSVDVSDDNLVFIILKDKNCRGLWDNFSIGTDDTQLKKKQFLTESNLQRELSDLDREASQNAEMPVLAVTTPQLSVVEMNERKLTIDIKPPKGKKKKADTKEETEEEEEDDEYDPPSSAEIEVVHRNPPPDLHSILKQRTVSESSEDFNNADPDSPRSEGEELSSSFGKKRSVSFSSYVDRTSFKSNCSVSSMTPALKSKRRRQRKREEKKKGRTRHNSEGTSSGDDGQISISDSYSYSEEEVDIIEKSGDGKKALHRAMSDPGPGAGTLTTIFDDEDEKEKGFGKHGKTVKKKCPQKAGEASSIPRSEDVLDFRTSETTEGVSVSVGNSADNCDRAVSEAAVEMSDEGKGEEKKGEDMDLEAAGEKNVKDRNKKIVAEIRSKLAGGDAASQGDDKDDDSDDDDFVDAVSSMTEDFSSKVGFDKSLVNNSDELEASGKSQDKLVEAVEKKENKGDGDSGGGGDSRREKSDVETALSWEDGGSGEGEHVTQCAFKFDNTVMFDLDVD